ncbi:AAA family ATPase [Cupriavidus basilensis]
MDGFEANSGVIVIAATNRSDVLDKALLRRAVSTARCTSACPTSAAARQILKVHMRKVPIGNDVERLGNRYAVPRASRAPIWPTWSNEAALFAARRSKPWSTCRTSRTPRTRSTWVRRKSTVMREEERRATAYHEVTAMRWWQSCLPKADLVHKVTIMPRGWALGVTLAIA